MSTTVWSEKTVVLLKSITRDPYEILRPLDREVGARVTNLRGSGRTKRNRL